MNLIKKKKPYKEARWWSYSMPSGATYSFSLAELEKDYERYCKMKKPSFIKNLPDIAHFACIVAYYKDLKPLDTLSDVGIIHELVHLMTIEKECPEFNDSYKKVREKFKELLKPY